MNSNEKLTWHTPTFRSLDANKTAQSADGVHFVTDDSTSDDFVVVADTNGGIADAAGADHS